jgi:hypothetical protein
MTIKIFDEKTNEYVLEKFAELRHHDVEPIKDISLDLKAKNAAGEYIPVGVTISSVLYLAFCN